MSSSAVKLFIFISCFLVADRIISGVASSVKTRRMKVEKPPEKVFDLDMAPNSVDDQFIGCEVDAEDLVKIQYLNTEVNTDSEVKRIWNENKNLDYFDRSIKVYTAKTGIYEKLNNEMTNGRINYKSEFRYKAFHFFLTGAIQKYKKQQMVPCQTVYRRTRVSFNQNVVNHEIRFGRFASASVEQSLTYFGNKSCFEIKTCYGADISKVSKNQNQVEVLIPPYEKFKVTAIKYPKDKYKKLNCEVIYILESTGTCSNMNCEILNKTSNMKC